MERWLDVINSNSITVALAVVVALAVASAVASTVLWSSVDGHDAASSVSCDTRSSLTLDVTHAKLCSLSINDIEHRGG